MWGNFMLFSIYCKVFGWLVWIQAAFHGFSELNNCGVKYGAEYASHFQS